MGACGLLKNGGAGPAVIANGSPRGTSSLLRGPPRPHGSLLRHMHSGSAIFDHSMSLSARTNIDVGIFKPRALAAGHRGRGNGGALACRHLGTVSESMERPPILR